MDRHLRNLERRVQGGESNLYPTLLSEYLRSEYIMRVPIELAAKYGNEAAQQVVGDIPQAKHDEIESDFFYRQLSKSSWVREFFLRRGVAIVQECLDNEWDLSPEDAWAKVRMRGSLREVNDFITLRHTLDPDRDALGPMRDGFIERIRTLHTIRTLFEANNVLELYGIDILTALCVAVTRECWWIAGGKIDEPNNSVSIAQGWNPLYGIFHRSRSRRALDAFREGDESNAYIQTMLELKIGARLDKWLLRPYTDYRGLQNVPPGS